MTLSPVPVSRYPHADNRNSTDDRGPGTRYRYPLPEPRIYIIQILWIPYSVYTILWIPYSVYTVLCIPYSIYRTLYILYSVYRTLYTVLSIYRTLYILYSVYRTLYTVLCIYRTQYRVGRFSRARQHRNRIQFVCTVLPSQFNTI